MKTVYVILAVSGWAWLILVGLLAMVYRRRLRHRADIHGFENIAKHEKQS